MGISNLPPNLWEYMAISDCAKEALFLSGLMEELGLKDVAKITIYNDNQGANKIASNPIHHPRTKHIDIRHHFVRDILKSRPIKLEYLPTESMIADVLTKGLPGSKHMKCIQGLGITKISKEERHN